MTSTYNWLQLVAIGWNWKFCSGETCPCFETWDWERQTVESSWRLFQHKEKETHFFLAFSVVLSGSDILRNISLLLDNQLHCSGFIILTTKWSFNRNWRVEGWIWGKLAKKVRSCSQRGGGSGKVGLGETVSLRQYLADSQPCGAVFSSKIL